MVKKVLLGVVVALVLFFGYVATRDGHFHYMRSGVIQAPPEAIYPYISDFEKGNEWSPYAETDPNMKMTINGPAGQVGTTMEFEGSSAAGSGKLEILNAVPNELVEIKLTMTKPFHAENLIQYKLTPEGEGTRFSWEMSGDGGFMGKLMSLLIDCEKMVGDQFIKGINNLKAVVEAKSQG